MENSSRLEQLIETLRTDEKNGLGDLEVSERLEKYGKNLLVPKKKEIRWGMLAFLKEPMIWLLAIAAAVYFALGEMLDAAVMLVAIVPIALIDIVIELQTDKALEKLEKLGEPFVSVVRNGARMKVKSEELVPGDIVIIEEGDMVMADCAILSSSDLSVDESALTGESEPMAKQRQELFSDEFFGNPGAVFAGTTVVSGKAVCAVVKTGSQTHYGKIGGTLGKTKAVKTPLQKDIEKIVETIGIFAIFLSLALIGVELYTGGSWSHAVIGGISLATAAIPEEFPVVFTLFLSLGMWRLAKANALVKKLSAVETLGSVNVICTDKTGTITQGRMAVSEIFTPGMAVEENAAGFLAGDGRKAGELLLYSLMACEKEPYDFMEKALFEYAKGSDAEGRIGRWELAAEYAFDAKTRHMSHVWSHAGELRICAKGSVEGILRICRMGGEEKKKVLHANERMGERGIRVLALATRKLEKIGGRTHDEKDLEFVALLGFADPIREGVAHAMEECQSAGIRVVMLTGDHKATAHAIAHQASIDHGEVIDGRQLEGLGEKEFLGMLRGNSIFSRVMPEQKLKIVEGLQKLGYSVAVTGDGINDAPALKKADIGVAMGQRGTEVSKEAAAFVLLDDNFKTIVDAVRNGRRIYDNLQKAFGYLIAFHVPIFLTALAFPLLGLPLLLLPIHIVLLEIVLHPVVSIVFEQEPEERDIMRRPPRDRKKQMLGSGEIARLVADGFLVFLGTAAMYWVAHSGGADEETARAMGFTAMLVGQVLLIAPLLSKKRMGAEALGNIYFLLTIVIVAVAYCALMYVPALAEIMKIAPLGAGEWALALGAGLVPVVFAELAKKF
ncbi:MAG: cation-translocating P-type ATPase [Candidatus Micrarchaeia archaeon]